MFKKIFIALILVFSIFLENNLTFGYDDLYSYTNYYPKTNQEKIENEKIINKIKNYIDRLTYKQKYILKNKLNVLYDRTTGKYRIQYLILRILFYKEINKHEYNKTREILQKIVKMGGNSNKQLLSYIQNITPRNHSIKGTYKPNQNDSILLNEIYKTFDKLPKGIVASLYTEMIKVYITHNSGYNKFILGSMMNYIKDKYAYAVITYESINRRYIKIPSKYFLDYNITYNELCNKYKKYCNYVVFSDKYKITSKELRIDYLAESIFLIKFLEENLDSDFEKKLYDDDLNKKTFIIKILNKRSNSEAGELFNTSSYKKITINMYCKDSVMKNRKVFFETLTHEFGHLIDLDYIVGNKHNWDNDKYLVYQNDKSVDFYKISWIKYNKMKYNNNINKNFVSGYAKTNELEDFAETFNMYLNHGKLFKEFIKKGGSQDLKKKYNYIDNIFHGHHINIIFQNLESLKYYPKFIPILVG